MGRRLQVLCVVAYVLQIICNCGLSNCDILVYNQDVPRLIEEEFRDMPAKFGDSLPLEGLRGFVVAGEPKDACKNIQAPPLDENNFTGKWVVLVARYNCSFEIKIRNAQNAGFNAVIVHNVNSSDLEVMSAKNPTGITIPSVFVSEETGYIIENNYIFNSGYFVVINGELPFNINTHLLLPFAVVVGLCLVIMIVFMIVKCIKDRRRARRHRLPYNSLKKIPICKFAKGDPYDTCAICLDDYLEGDKLRVLPCAHAYHCKCIDPWLTKNRRVCPVCKRRVFAAGESRRRSRRHDPEEGNTGHSSSETDDDRTPLVHPANTVTQGGTFNEQRANPLQGAHQNTALFRLFRALSRSVTEELSSSEQQQGEPQNPATQNDETANASADPNNESQNTDEDNERAVLCGRRDRVTHLISAGGSCPEQMPRSEVEQRQYHSSSNPFLDGLPNQSPGNPFLTGVLNMRGDHFAMTRDDDDGPETAASEARAQPSTNSDRSPGCILNRERSKAQKKKEKKQKKSKSGRNRSTSENDAHDERSPFVNPDEHSINAPVDDEEANPRIGVAAIPNAQFVQPGSQPASGSGSRSRWSGPKWDFRL